MPEPLRIVMADDSYLVREGARRLLEDSGDVVVAAAVGSAPELLDAVGRLRPAAVLTDIRMPPRHRVPAGQPSMEGIDAARQIRAAYPSTGVVVLSQYADESYAFELFRDGTAGLAYLLKDRIGEVGRLLEALREVSAGGSVIDPQVVEALVQARARVRASRARRAAGNGARTRQRRHRRPAAPVGVLGGKARQRHLHQARPDYREPVPPPGHGGAGVPARCRPARLSPEQPAGTLAAAAASSLSRPAWYPSARSAAAG
jgi:DNA-binding NarL/FixJ family response regulator